MKQIIFDLDDTLYKNLELRERREEAILEFLKDKKEDYLELRKNNGTIKSLNKLGISKKEFFDLMNKVPILLKKDNKLIEILKKLRERYSLVVLSNNSDYCIQEILEKLGVICLIDKCYSVEDFERLKPAKECFFMVQEGDICVGNNFKKDLRIPKQMGAITVLLGDDCNADFNIDSIYELETLFDKF